MTVLLPLLIRPTLVDPLRERYQACVDALDAPVRIVRDEEAWAPAYDGENYWGRFARMRQAVIDVHLRDEDWVLWVDADIGFDPDLFRRLRATTQEPAVVAPLVLIEHTGTNYDTAGTRPTFGQRSDLDPPREIQPMFSVGGCVLVPAEVHRLVRFEAQADSDESANTEWTSLCVGARAHGYKVLWNTLIEVVHADLPAYGEEWH